LQIDNQLNSLHLVKKAPYHESTKENINFVLSPPEADVFVMNPYWFRPARARRM